MTRPPPLRPAEERLVADACARSRAVDVGRLAGDDAVRRVALNLALEAERA